ncbi:MAG: metal-sensitive transcriptional regulator [Clostridia bacterium]|nr:metal-sensitive transcriptional regulator [Clostridia bacterium]
MVNDEKQNILKRLRRIEGQVKGIQRMIENDACCVDILVQVAAVKAAVNKTGALIFEHHAKECISKSLATKSQEDVIKELMQVLTSFIK